MLKDKIVKSKYLIIRKNFEICGNIENSYFPGKFILNAYFIRKKVEPWFNISISA